MLYEARPKVTALTSPGVRGKLVALAVVQKSDDWPDVKRARHAMSNEIKESLISTAKALLRSCFGRASGRTFDPEFFSSRT